MSNNSQPKRHHYVPVCYLSGFANGSGKLAVYDRCQQVAREQAPEKVAVERHLYSWILPDGNKDISAENIFDLMRESYSMLCQKASITIIHSPQQRAFITNDRPVLVLKRDPAALGVAGFLGRGSRVFMPVSKRIALLMNDGRPGMIHREADRTELNHYNRDLAVSSVRFLFGDDSQRLSSIASKARLSQRSPGPSIEFPDIS